MDNGPFTCDECGIEIDEEDDGICDECAEAFDDEEEDEE